MKTMQEDGFQKVEREVTTVEEVLRVVQEDRIKSEPDYNLFTILSSLI
ncbi:MAG: hypothetical protein AB1422_11710 [bacterium]